MDPAHHDHRTAPQHELDGDRTRLGQGDIRRPAQRFALPRHDAQRLADPPRPTTQDRLGGSEVEALGESDATLQAGTRVLQAGEGLELDGQVSRELVAAATRKDRQQGDVLRDPEARSSTTFRLGEGENFEILQGEGAGGRLVHAGSDESERLIGFALEAQGMGYADVIRILYGYSFAEDAVVGIRVLETKETPGLGDKIETDPDFLQNFERLDASLTEDLSAILHPVEMVKHGKKEHPWQVDAITGATISSRAIADMLSKSTSFWVPVIRQNMDDFRKAEPEGPAERSSQ